LWKTLWVEKRRRMMNKGDLVKRVKEFVGNLKGDIDLELGKEFGGDLGVEGGKVWVMLEEFEERVLFWYREEG
jgi:hypothetical protein